MLYIGSQTKPGARQVAAFREGGNGRVVVVTMLTPGHTIGWFRLQGLLFNALPSSGATGPLNCTLGANSKAKGQEEQTLRYSLGR